MGRTGGYLLDGIPRTLAQAQVAHAAAVDRGVPAHAAVTFEVPRAVLVSRLLERAQADGRTDDDEKTVLHRLDVYDRETEPVVTFYEELGVLIGIDANRPVGEVTASTIAALRAVLGRA
jgi:adenylate kinase